MLAHSGMYMYVLLYVYIICMYKVYMNIHVHVHVHSSYIAAWALQLLCWKYSDLCTLGMYVKYKTHSYRLVA